MRISTQNKRESKRERERERERESQYVCVNVHKHGCMHVRMHKCSYASCVPSFLLTHPKQLKLAQAWSVHAEKTAYASHLTKPAMQLQAFAQYRKSPPPLQQIDFFPIPCTPPPSIFLPPALTPPPQPFFQSQPQKQNKTATQFFHITLCLTMMHHHHTKFGYKRLGGFRRCLLDKTRTHGQTAGQSARRTDNQPQTPSHKGRQPARTDRQPARRTDNQAQGQTPSRDNNNQKDFYSAHQQHKVGGQSALQQY